LEEFFLAEQKRAPSTRFFQDLFRPRPISSIGPSGNPWRWRGAIPFHNSEGFCPNVNNCARRTNNHRLKKVFLILIHVLIPVPLLAQQPFAAQTPRQITARSVLLRVPG
jgi:hypothetical protein